MSEAHVFSRLLYCVTISLVVILATSSCHLFTQKPGNISKIKTIFGSESRRPAPRTENPYKFIGRLHYTTPDGQRDGSCTATLVGNDLILTAAHCIVDWKTGVFNKNIRFNPGYHQGQSRFQTTVISARYSKSFIKMKDDTVRHANDWAIGRLKTPLGKKLGYLNIEVAKPQPGQLRWFMNASIVTMAGYARNYGHSEIQSFQNHCRINDLIINGNFGHDCDSGPGASGGPLLVYKDNQYRIVAIHAYGLNKHHPTYTKANSNEAVPAARFAATLAEERATEYAYPQTTLQVCNDTEINQILFSVVYNRRSQEGWTGKHWFPVIRGACTEVVIADHYVGRVYLHGRGAGQQWHGHDKKFCHSLDVMTLTNADTRACTGYRFEKVSYTRPMQVSYRRFNQFRFQ